MDKKKSHKVFREGFWWPNLFKYAHNLVKRCDACQRFNGKLKFSRNMPLKLVEVQVPL